MSPAELAENWSHQFGLALGPLFEPGENSSAHEHFILLDGGYGSFVLSASEEELWRKVDVAGWVWSSDIPHHVTVTPSKVGVLRWDRPTMPRVFERAGVERSKERFYEYLIEDRLRSNRSVVDHLLGFFRRIRSLVNYAGIEDSRTTDVFMATLASMIAPDDSRVNPENYGLAEDAIDLTGRVSSPGLIAARAEIYRAPGSLS